MLGDRHADLVSLLSRPTASRFEGIEFAICADGAAVLPQALASFTVDRHAQIDAGDHVLIMLHALQLHRDPQQAATRLYLADADTPDIRLGKVHGTLMVDVVATNAKLQRRALRIVTETTGTTTPPPLRRSQPVTATRSRPLPPYCWTSRPRRQCVGSLRWTDISRVS
ncbi:flavin reductase family protein [Yimella lutea]|uniref:flavin reductase family protein n=1 Tax=Yimella lutea TaxID=587872 RepID=UPI001B885AFA|nr:flavin reductase family protein [Yimella lutea]